ncbi:MAG: nucleotide excision repair endonuclease, partial [Acidobacteriota bacterium]|nr:nucleotide excision repair endonuclease [Acidobacteriota bacterium]
MLALRKAAAPRSSADLAREFLGTGPLDERQAELVLGPVLAQHPRLVRTAHGWTVREQRSGRAEAGPRLGDGFLAVFAPARTEIAVVQRGGPPGGAPAYTVCAAGESEARRFELLTGECVAAPIVDLTEVARRLHGYRGPPDPVRIAERLACPHVESDDPEAVTGVIASAWERLADQLRLDGVETPTDLFRLLDDRLEAADFQGKEFGPGELRDLPEGPGVYAFVEGRGAQLYVGQSSTLGARVRSYFVGPPRDEKDREIRRGAVTLETRATDSAPDALIDEARWIRERRPRLNTKEAVSLDAVPDGIVIAPRLPRGSIAFTIAG